MRQSLPERDDDDTSRYGRQADYHAGDAAVSSWSWTGLALLCVCGAAASWLIYAGLVAVIAILTK